MKYGIVYAYWSKDWEGEYIKTIERAANCGFDVLEIFTPLLLTLPQKKLEEVKAAAEERKIELSFLIGLGERIMIFHQKMMVCAEPVLNI